MKKIFYVFALLCAAMLTSCDSERLTPEGDPTKLWPAGKNGSEFMGYINKSGELEIPAKFDETSGFSCGWGLVAEDGDYKFIDKSNKKSHAIDKEEFGGMYAFYYNYIRFADGKYYGMYDNDFSVAISADYEFLGTPSADNLVYFAEDPNDDEGWGYLDMKGKVAIKPQWCSAHQFVDGMAVVCEKRGTKEEPKYYYGIINKKGDYITEPQKNYIQSAGEDRFILEKSSGKVVLCDKNLMELGSSYDRMIEFSCGLARVYKDEKGYGYIDAKGNEVIPCKYTSAASFMDDVAWVKKDADSRCELLDKNGNSLIKLKEDEDVNSHFHNGLSCIYSYDSDFKEYSYRYIDKDGNNIYKWTPGDEEDAAPARRAPKAENWEEVNRRSLLQTSVGALVIANEEARARRK